MPSDTLFCGVRIFGFEGSQIDFALRWLMYGGGALLLLGTLWPRAARMAPWGLGLALLSAMLYAIHVVWLLGGTFVQTYLGYLLSNRGGNLLVFLLGLALALLALEPRYRIARSGLAVVFILGLGFYSRL